MKRIISIQVLFIVICASINAQDYNIMDFGAKQGFDFVNTEAVLKASGNLKDFLSLAENGMSVGENVEVRGLIVSDHAENISISGNGIIDCSSDLYKIPGELHNPGDLDVICTRQGSEYLDHTYGTSNGPVKMQKRPGYMIYLVDSRSISIKDIRLIDSPHWAIRIEDCKDVQIRGIDLINDPRVPNSDGIHFTCSENVTVSDCHIGCGDDAICFTTFGDRELMTQNVVVSNCVLRSRSSGIRIGYGPHDLQNISFSNLVIKQTENGKAGKIDYCDIKFPEYFISALQIESCENSSGS